MNQHQAFKCWNENKSVMAIVGGKVVVLYSCETHADAKEQATKHTMIANRYRGKRL